MKKLILILSLSLMSVSAFAQDAFYASGMLGLTNVDSDSNNIELKTELSYGVRAGLLFNDHVAAGVYINRYSGGDSNAFNGLVDYDIDLTNIMAEVTYFFTPADENSFFVSGLLGVTQSNPDCSGATCDGESDTSYGATVGYNFMLAPNFSLAPQLTYVHVDAEEAYSMTTASANFTVWF